MQWTKEHDDLLVKEVFALDPLHLRQVQREAMCGNPLQVILMVIAISSLLYLEDQSRTGFNLCS